MARPLRGRRIGAGHATCRAARHEGAQPAQQQRRDIRSLHRRPPAPRQGTRGNITIVWFDNGWFWFIPLSDGTTSVGAVCPAPFFKNRGTDLPAFFRQIIASSPEISNRLRDAELVGEVTATGNYSYSSRQTSGDRFLMVGDACAFIDPVFSTGVYLAMVSAFAAADAVGGCLANPRKTARLLRRYDAKTQKALGSFTWFIYRIREPAMRNLFMSPRNMFRVEEAVLSILAGAIFDGWQVRGAALPVPHDLLRDEALAPPLPAEQRPAALLRRQARGDGKLRLDGCGRNAARSYPQLQHRHQAGRDRPRCGAPLATALSGGRRQHRWLG